MAMIYLKIIFYCILTLTTTGLIPARYSHNPYSLTDVKIYHDSEGNVMPNVNLESESLVYEVFRLLEVVQ